MDDIAKRREARRRKILENAQNRLKKIGAIERKSINYLPPEVHFNENLSVENASQLDVNSSSTSNNEENHFVPQTSTYFQPQILQENGDVQRTLNEILSTQPKKLNKQTIIVIMAIVVNLILLVLERIYDQEEINSLHLNKIFIPLLLFETIHFFENKLYRLGRNYFLLFWIFQFMQNFFIYFFVFVCCHFLKELINC